MAVRTTPEAVESLLLRQYDTVRRPAISGFIDVGNSLTNKVASNDSEGLLDDSDLELIERNLAAWSYGMGDPLLSRKQTGRASGTYQGQTAMHLDYNCFGQQAMILDVTGYLASLNQKAKEGPKKAGFIWLGTDEADIEAS